LLGPPLSGHECLVSRGLRARFKSARGAPIWIPWGGAPRPGSESGRRRTAMDSATGAVPGRGWQAAVRVGASIAAAFGGAALAGWLGGTPALASLHRLFIPMAPNTAVA